MNHEAREERKAYSFFLAFFALFAVKITKSVSAQVIRKDFMKTLKFIFSSLDTERMFVYIYSTSVWFIDAI